MRHKFLIWHVPGKELLSRSPLDDSKIEDALSNEVEAYIQLIVKHSDNCLIQIRKSQEQDMVFKNLRSQCLKGIKRGTPGKLYKYSARSLLKMDCWCKEVE